MPRGVWRAYNAWPRSSSEAAMKSTNIKIGINELDAKIRFYTAIFGQAPAQASPVHALWIFEDPDLEFSIALESSQSIQASS